MEIKEGETIRLVNAIEKLNGSLERFERVSGISIGGINNSNKFSFGNVGVWICVTCVIVMLVSNFYQSKAIDRQYLEILDMSRRVDRIEDYRQTEYMLIPDLKKIVDKEMAKQTKEKK